MHSSPESRENGTGSGGRLRRWNRRLHVYAGLYFLFFIWLFALTGLLLNHSTWSFAEFWPMRKVTSWEKPLAAPPAGSPLEEAGHLLSQLELRGEIDWLAVAPDPDRLDFRVVRPGTIHEIKFDRRKGSAAIQRTEVNGWGIFRVLHTFTGTRVNDTRNQRDWILTTLWVIAMDALAAGLVALALGGVWLWWDGGARRLSGLVALAGGVIVCGWFVWGLRWFWAA